MELRKKRIGIRARRRNMNASESIARTILSNYASVFYVSTPHQQERVIRDAAEAIQPQLHLLAEAAAREMSANPS